MKQQKLTRFVKAEEADKKWYVVDAKGMVLGRLATEIARLIRGKHKPVFTPNMDAGDFVIVINADKVKMTGKRELFKEYFSYTGYPGGARFAKFSDVKKTKPEFAIRNAVRGMLPKTKLGDKIIKNLKVYAGEVHPHAAQQPEQKSI
ncbi:MAG: 50S ribosomal protein L13 [bacterium]